MGEAVHEWLPKLLGVMPWISTRDLAKGGQWQHEILENLRASQFGVVCLTPDNLARPWMLFEAGAISTLPSVYTFLHHVNYVDVAGPLAMFNHTASQRDDVLKMVISLNNALGAQKVTESVLKQRFAKFWPDLEGNLNQIQADQHVADIAAPRDQNAIMAEILTVVRDTSKEISRSFGR